MGKKYHILALSGGGFRGLFTARILADLEEAADKPIGQCFDLICGTSIGGIIALGLGIEKPAKDIADIIEKQGKDIFPAGKFGFKSAKSIKSIFCAKHSNKPLCSVVNTMFGEKTMKDSKRPLLIPVVNYSTGKTRVFKTLCGSHLVVDRPLKMADVAMATSAAPYYLPMWRMSAENGSTVYLDGGLCANAPGLLGVHELVFNIKKDIDCVSVLSIGTMQMNPGIGKGSLKRGGLMWGWKAPLFDITISAQESLTDFMLKQQLGERYQMIEGDPRPDQVKDLALDSATEDAANILRSAAQNEFQKFIGLPQSKKWLSHIPVSDFDNKE